MTLGLTVATIFLGMILAFILVLFRQSNMFGLVHYARFHVWLFRGTPLLVQLIIIYTGLPQLGFFRLNVVESALLGLVMNEAAYLSEILRAGISSVPNSQRDAAKALGLNSIKTFTLIVLPQALTVFQEYEHFMLGLIIIVSMIFMRDGMVPMLAKLTMRAKR